MYKQTKYIYIYIYIEREREWNGMGLWESRQGAPFELRELKDRSARHCQPA